MRVEPTRIVLLLALALAGCSKSASPGEVSHYTPSAKLKTFDVAEPSAASAATQGQRIAYSYDVA